MEGKAHDIDPLHQECNIKCYYLPKIKSDLSEDEKKKAISERHKLLCKYGKNTGWCTASPSGTYHEIYKYDEIYIIHDNNIPIYQFVHCTKAVKNYRCQFMDINDKMPNDDEFIKMKPSVYKFINKYFPEVFEFYRLEEYGLDDIGKMVMDLEDNPENEEKILQELEEKRGDFSQIAQFYVDKNLPIPDIFQEFILRNYILILSGDDRRKFVNFIVDNINNPLSQKILNSELDAVNIQHILINSKNIEEMAKALGSENINKLTADGVSYLLGRAKNLKEMATFLGTKNINKLTDDYIYYFLKEDEKNLREMAKILGPENINKLTDSNIFQLLKDAKNVREMGMILGKENINKLGMIGSYYVFHLLKDAKNVREMGMILGKENLNKFKDEDFLDLIIYSIDIEGLLEIMGTEILNKISLGTLISVKKWIQDNYVNKNIINEKNYNNKEKILNILDQIIEPKWKNAHSK